MSINPPAPEATQSAPAPSPEAPQPAPTQNVPSLTDNFTGLPEQYASDPDFANFKSPDDVFKEFKNLKSVQANRDANGMIVIPKEDAPPEEWEQIYKKLGKPESSAEYELARPENLPEGLDFSDEMLAEYADVAHKLNLTKAQAQQLMEWKNAKDMEQYSNFETAKEETLEANLSKLEELWGGKADSDAFKANHKAATKAFNAVADQGLAEQFKADPFLASNPTVMETLARLGKMMSDDTVPSITEGIPTPKFGDSLSSVEAAIDKFHKDGKFATMVNSSGLESKKYQEEWRALNDKRQQILTSQ